MLYQLKINEQDFAVELGAQQAGSLRVAVNGTVYDVTVVQGAGTTVPRVTAVDPPSHFAPGGAPAAAPAEAPAAPRSLAAAVEGAVLAPIPGLIVEIKVRVGDTVQAGQTVAVMEAMKMENNLVAQMDGMVREILVQKGSEVATGDVIVRIGQ